MPAPKVASVEEFFERLDDVQRPHLEALREVSLAEAAKAGVKEELKHNFPAYTLGVMVWTLQCFKKHCSIRFPVSFFQQWREEVAAAGYEAIDGALKIRWDQPVPTELVGRIIEARIEDFQAGNTVWSSPGAYSGTKK